MEPKLLKEINNILPRLKKAASPYNPAEDSWEDMLSYEAWCLLSRAEEILITLYYANYEDLNPNYGTFTIKEIINEF